MIFFLKKVLSKSKAYYYYFVNKNSRKYFFVLISRKASNLFNKLTSRKQFNYNVNEWCKKKKIPDFIFYKKIGINSPKNFYKDYNSFYFSAKLRQKKLNYKMGGMANLNLIYNLIKHYKPKKILETGVAFGWSTLAIILSKNTSSKLISIDLSYPTKLSEKLVGLALPYNFKNKYKLLMGIDYDFLISFKDQNKKFDFIHYDSDKSYDGRMKNYKLIWDILNKNGCFVSDDISDNSAFYDFVVSKKLNYHILCFDNKYIGIIFK